MSFTAASTGGYYRVILTEGQMPKHSHFQNVVAPNGQGTGIRSDYNSDCTKGGVYPQNCSTSEKGNNESHNNMQPYITVYFWKRTA